MPTMTEPYVPIRHRDDLTIARDWYAKLADDSTARWATAMAVGPANAAAVRQAAREELSTMIEEWHGDAPARLVRRARAQIERLR